MSDESRKPTITAAEFEQQYAAKSGISVERLRALGRVVRPCHCDYDGCAGWQSVHGDIIMVPALERLRTGDLVIWAGDVVKRARADDC